MNINIPTTKQQKDFEQWAQVVIKILSELSEDDRKRIYDFIIFTYNK